MTSSPMRVFVVDDDLDTTECMRLLFQLWGLDVHVANAGAAAIDRAPQIKPDLMLIDLGMPEVDGLQVARRLRACRELAQTSMIAVTGYADPSHRDQALAAGFDECLVKPLPVEEMIALIERVRARVSMARAPTGESTTRHLERAAFGAEYLASATACVEAAPPEAVAPTPIAVRLARSGISDVLYLSSRGSAERLRQWLRERGCRAGPVFEPKPGEFAFFNYSRRQMRRLLRENREYRVAE